jgi:hypothetical protein
VASVGNKKERNTKERKNVEKTKGGNKMDQQRLVLILWII